MGELEQFLNTLRYEKRYSSHTISAYSHDINSFQQFISIEYNIDELEKVELHMLRSWLMHLSSQGLKSKHSQQESYSPKIIL